MDVQIYMRHHRHNATQDTWREGRGLVIGATGQPPAWPRYCCCGQWGHVCSHCGGNRFGGVVAHHSPLCVLQNNAQMPPPTTTTKAEYKMQSHMPATCTCKRQSHACSDVQDIVLVLLAHYRATGGQCCSDVLQTHCQNCNVVILLNDMGEMNTTHPRCHKANTNGIRKSTIAKPGIIIRWFHIYV